MAKAKRKTGDPSAIGEVITKAFQEQRAQERESVIALFRCSAPLTRLPDDEWNKLINYVRAEREAANG